MKLKNENEELKNKMDNKRIYIKQLKDKNLSLTELIEPMSRKIADKDAEIEALTKEKDAWKTMYSELKSRVVGA